MIAGYIAALVSGIIFGALVGRMIRDLARSEEMSAAALRPAGLADPAPAPAGLADPVSAPAPASLADPVSAPAPAPEPGPAPAPSPAAAAPAAPEEPEPSVIARAAEAEEALVQGGDDLTAIKGVGPKLETVLHEHGVTRYQQIAEWSSADIERMDAALNFRGRIARDAWVEQATELHRRKYG